MGDPLRIAIITNSLTGGGAERAMNTLARELTKYPAFKIVLIPINSGLPDLIDPECAIVSIDRTWRGSLFDSIKAFFRFQRIMFEVKPNVVLLNCDLPEFFFSLSVSKARIFVVEHSTKSWVNHPILGEIVWRLLRWRTFAIVRVSNRIPVRNPPPKRDLVIFNPLPRDIQTLETPAVQSSQARICFVGRISEEKDPQFFCEIASRSKMATLVIGDGVLRGQLQNSYPHFLWAGQVANPWSMLGHGDLLVMTSRFEGDGLVLLEALANNLPVLVRATDDFRSFNLPKDNYFESLEEAAERIDAWNMGTVDLILDPLLVVEILQGRNPEKIAQSWSDIILSES
jgi:glycosyltransferase involved in cell wall biosynthesis